MKSNAYSDRKPRSKGNAFGSSLRRYWPNGVGPDLPISNINHYGFGQANARINNSNQSYGQAQASIKQVYNAHGQAQAHINFTSNGFGQAQADIKHTYYGLGQAQALIQNSVGRGFGQTQAYIRPRTGLGQAQAFIVKVNSGLGQANARITGFGWAFGQAQASLRSNVKSGQANALISSIHKQKFGQALAYVLLLAGFGQAQAYILQDKVFGQASALIKRTERGYGQSQAHIKLYRHPLAQAQAFISTNIYSTGQAQALIVNGRQHGQAQAYIIVPKRYGQAQAYIVKSRAFGQSQGLITGISKPHAQAQAFMLTTGQIADIQLTDHLEDAFTYNFTNVDYVIFSDFIGYTNDFDPSDEPDGWLIFTLDSSTFLRIETYQSDGADTLLTVYTGDSGPVIWTVEAFNDDSAEGGVQSLIEQVFPAGTYLLEVGFFSYLDGQSINTRVNSGFHQIYGQAQALITRKIAFGQARARVKKTVRGHGLARAFIGSKINPAQAQAFIIHIPKNSTGQAQAIIYRQMLAYGLAQARIVKNAGYGQARARIYAFAQQKVGQAQARILASVRHYSVAQAQAVIRGPAFGQAQALISGGRYLVRYNNHTLPGYAQSEDYNSIISIQNDRVTYEDASFAEYTGLTNKVISLRMKALGSTYREVKDQVQDAATMVRSGKGFKKLYIQHTDKYYEAITKSISIDQSVSQSMRMLDYEVEFEAKPWLISEITHTVSGVGSISTTGRTFSNGGWTPATLLITGTNVIVSGYTATQNFTGFLSVSGVATNLRVDTEAYTATINGENKNAIMYTPDYEIYVGPGETFFNITGASSIIITWRDRWYL